MYSFSPEPQIVNLRYRLIGYTYIYCFYFEKNTLRIPSKFEIEISI